MMNIAPSKVRCHFPLKQLNTFGVKAYASNFVLIRDRDYLQDLLSNYVRKEVDVLVLGGGSNILFTQDYQGLVIKNEITGIDTVEETADWVKVKVGGGEVWHDFVMHCVANDWGGVENLSLIPGSVGAAPIQNIGAYGVELKDVFESLEAVHLDTGVLHTFTKAECEFGYRNSVFKTSLKGQFMITSVTFTLTKHNHRFNTSYGAIAKVLEEQGVEALSLKAVSDAVIAIRTSKLPNPAEIGNCGSFFKNPEITKEQFETIAKQHPNIPHYSASKPSLIKVPAGWLIEQCGWKGKAVGNVGTYHKQALVLINLGNATGEEAKNMAYEIQASVAQNFGVELQPEVNIL